MAKEKNHNSESNGCLMKLSPLVLYCLNLSDLEIEKVVRAEVALTHPN